MARSWSKGILGALLLAGALALACATERGVEPKPGDYRLYVGVRGHEPAYEAYVLVVDCETDSVVDSIGRFEGTDMLRLTVSSDGQYVGVQTARPPQVWDVATKTRLLTTPKMLSSLVFLPEEGVLLGAGRDSVLVFSLPDFQLQDVRRVELMSATRIPGTSRLLGLHFWNDQSPPFPHKYVVYDFAQDNVVDTFVIDVSSLGSGVFLAPYFVVSPDRRRLFGIGYDDIGYAVVGYDLNSHRAIFRHPYDARGGVGNCRLTPDGRELWYTHGANCFDIPWRTSIEIIDARTGEFLDTVAVALDGWPWLGPWDIRFTPSGAKAYINCGSTCSFGPLLVIDTKSRQITKILLSDHTRNPSAIDLAPEP